MLRRFEVGLDRQRRDQLAVVRFRLEKVWEHMRLVVQRIACFAGPMLVLIADAYAQGSIKILQPSEDTCAAFVAAMDSHDRTELLSLGGWVLGFLSGVAETKGSDILHDTTSEGVLDQVYGDCQAQPNQALSSVVERIARELSAVPP